MGAVTAGGRIEVDPEVLLRAGQRIGSIGTQLDALSGALGAALGSGVASGWDPAGAHFGLTYGDAAQEFADVLAAAANAFKYTGQRLEATGYNYKNADAGSTIGGGGPMGSVGAAPSETKPVDAPTGPSGAIVPPPANWWLIEGLLNAIPGIGPFAGAVMTWPTGNPSLMHLTAAQWKNFATGLSAFNDEVPALKTALSQQHIPEQGKIQECLGDLAEYLPWLSEQATTIATNTDDFANGVQKAQDAIRRLLDRVSLDGLWDTVTGIFTGDGLDILRQIADDVGTVLENFQNEVKGIVGLLADLSKALGDALDVFQKWVRKPLTAVFGDELGNTLADGVTFYTDIQLGLINGVIGTVSGLVSLADADTWKGMAEMAASVAEDPTKLPGVLENMGKQFIAYDQLTGDHPGRGVGEAAFNIGSLFVPGGALTKTGSIAKGLRYGSKLLEEGRLPRISDLPGLGNRTPPSLDNLPGAGPGHPGVPEFTPPRVPDSLVNPSTPHAPETPHTPQGLGGSGGPPGGGPPDPPGGRPVGPPDSVPGRADGPAPQSPSSGAVEPPRVSEPSAPSPTPSSGDAPAPAAQHAPEEPSPASPHDAGHSPSEPGPSPAEHSPSGNGVTEPRGDGNYAPNESHQPASEGYTGRPDEGAHAPAGHQPAHTPAAESPGTHEQPSTDGGQPREPSHAPGDVDARPHEPAATAPAPMAGGMPMAPHAPAPVHSPSDGGPSRAQTPEPSARTPESKAPQAGSPEGPRTQTPASAGPGPGNTPSAPVHPAAGHPSGGAGEPPSSGRPAGDAPEARPRQPAPESRGPVGPSQQEPPKPPDTPRAPTEPGQGDGAPTSEHDPNHPGEDSSHAPGGDHDGPLFDESGAGYPDSYPLPPASALVPPHDGAFFWSGRDAEGVGVGPESAGGNGSAARIADSFDGTTLEGLLERNGIEPPKWSPDDPAAERWWSDVSDMYAGNVSGEVRAVVGSQLRPGNIWESVELPRLMENPNVTRITQIDAETGHATEVFSRRPDIDSGPGHDRSSQPSGGDSGVESRSPAGTHESDPPPPEPSTPPADDTPTTPEAPGNEHSTEGRQSGGNEATDRSAGTDTTSPTPHQEAHVDNGSDGSDGFAVEHREAPRGVDERSESGDVAGSGHEPGADHDRFSGDDRGNQGLPEHAFADHDAPGDRSRIYSLMDETPHTTAFAPEQLLDNQRVADALDRHGVSKSHFVDLINRATESLTPVERDLINAVRSDLPAPTTATVMQKVIPPGHFDHMGNLVQSRADDYIMGNNPRTILDQVGGSVTLADDTSHLTTPRQIHDGLRLDYSDTPFAPHDPGAQIVRFQADPDTTGFYEVPRNSDMGGNGDYDGWDDPFTGNGFTKSGDDVVPEYFAKEITMREGAEMWEVLDDGTQRLVAVLKGDAWIPQGN